MKSNVNIILAAIVLMAFSCSRKAGDDWVVTDRIQYDVVIKSPEPDLEWWIQNIEGKNREAFILQMLDAAYSGKVRTYDYYNYRELSGDQVRSIGSRIDTLSFRRNTPPYDFYDTIIRKELSIYNITRIRFIEEWKLNNKTLELKKYIIGMAPLVENFDEDGNLRGFMPLFWIFFDEKYPGNLER
ncbi:MAG: hypothetical protein U1C46_07695 [Bacteroidales bacterium]|nr:hypothetical protein [Bacteroidales bacterium]MDZ4204687.1 hypothetical protein [Bacteroidales bacterium]